MFKIEKNDKVVSRYVKSNSNKKAIIVYKWATDSYQVQIAGGFFSTDTLETVKNYKRLGNAKNYLLSLDFHSYINGKGHMEISRLIKYI